MTRALLLAAAFVSAVVVWRVMAEERPPEPRRWVEDDDGIQPADTYPSGLIAVRDPADRKRFTVKAEYRPGAGWTSTGWDLDV